MNKNFNFSVVAIAVSFLVSQQANAANTWAEARNDAMGGTGVASANYGSGVLINPALLAKAKPEDSVTVILPAVGAQITDKDNLPNETLSLAFVAKGYAHGRVSSSIDQGDIDYLRRIEGSDTYALVEAGKAAIEGSDEITKHLNSTASGRAAIVSDYGIAVARQFTFGDVPVSIGVTPKLQKTWLYNYTTSIYNYDSSDWNSSRYRNDDTGFNVDAGIAADFGEHWTVGISGQNLISRDLDTKSITITHGMTGETRNYKDTYQIRPLVTAGVAWQNELLTLSADGDLTETKGFKSEENSQYVGVGAEVRPLDWLAVRAGYRADVKDNDSNVFTGGVGFAPFNRVHLDLMGLYGEDETWGAG
ncbi:hypothetical protein GKF98_22265, partial [Escherichia coli]|nr:hypothetical protein [Escherichia coli]